MRDIRWTLLAATALATGCGPSDRTAMAFRSDDASSAASDESAITLQRLSTGGQDFATYSPAPDGSFLTASEAATGDLAVVDPRSRDLRALNPRGWVQGWVERAAVSPDGERIAYTWFSAAEGYQIRVIGVDGSGDRLLKQMDVGSYGAVAEWSEDGSILAVEQNGRGAGEGDPTDPTDDVLQIVTVSSQDGATRVLYDLGPRWPSGLARSEDGLWVAFSHDADRGDPAHDIYVIPADGGEASKVLRTPGSEELLGWVPGEDALLIYADHSVWKLPLSNGDAAGGPELVRPDLWNLRSVGFSQVGFFYEVFTGEAGVMTASVSLESMSVLTPPSLVHSGPERGEWPAWSPDGRYLAYVPSSRAPATTNLVIRTIDSGERRELLLPLDELTNLWWHPDGESILGFGERDQVRRGIYRIELSTGEVRLVVPVEPGPLDLRRYALSPDGQTLYYRRRRIDGEWIVGRDLESGSETPILRREAPIAVIVGGGIGVSPDGTMLAYREGGGGSDAPILVKVAPVDGGEPRVVYTPPEGRTLRGHRTTFDFTPDGTHLVFITTSLEGGVAGDSSEILAVPIDGGEPQVLMRLEQAIDDLRMTPDGRRIAFTVSDKTRELWLMQGLGGA